MPGEKPPDDSNHSLTVNIAQLVVRPLEAAQPMPLTFGGKRPNKHGRAVHFFSWRALILVLIALGAALRLWQYAGNASLWVDEISVARNVLDRPLHTLLTKPLDYDQVAPPGFLLLTKSAVVLVGNNEYALRLFPLLCALLSLPLFWRLARQVLSGPAVPFAMALFALAPIFIRYGAEVKQYSVDVAAALLMTVLALDWQAQRTARRAFLLGIIGAVIVWFSQVAVIVLAGLGLALAVSAMMEADRATLRALVPTALLWGAAALAAMAAGWESMTPTGRAYVYRVWQGGFMPMPPHSIWEARWLWRTFLTLFEIQLGYPWPAAYVGVMALGFWSLWRTRRGITLVLLTPTVVALIASAAQLYPFRGRLILFLLPALLIAVAAGADWMRRALPPRLGPAGAVAMALFLVPPSWALIANLPVYRFEDSKPMFAYVQAHRRPGDAVYVHYGAGQAAAYYGPQHGLHLRDIVIGGRHRGDIRAYFHELDQFRGRPRIWVIFSHLLPQYKERPAILSYLDCISVRRDSIAIRTRGADAAPSVSAHLYDLSDGERLATASADTHPLPDDHAARGVRIGCSPSGSDGAEKDH